MKQITDADEIRKMCEKVIDSNPRLVRRYKNGKQSEFPKLVHKTFELSNKRANIPLVKDTLKQLLNP